MYVTVKNQKTYFETSGEGRPMLFVHGWRGSRKSLYKLYKQASKKYKAYILDLPGFGDSEVPKGSWGVSEYSDFLYEFIKTQEIKDIVYFGHSFGGGLGICLASEHPEIFAGLVLSGAAFRRNMTVSPVVKVIKRVVPKYQTIKSKLGPARKMFYRVFYPRSDAFKSPELEESYRKIISEDLSGLVKDIKIPTLVLWGVDDKYTPVSDADYLEENLQKVEVVKFEKKGHDLPIKHTKEVLSEVDDFIRRSFSEE